MRPLLSVIVVSLAVLCPCPVQSDMLLKVTVGGSVTFPAPVVQEGFLNYGDDGKIARMSYREITGVYVERFKGRVLCDNSTRFFHIRNLSTQDTGKYTVEDIRGGSDSITVFQLTVYNRVSKPVVTLSAKGSPPDTLCTLQCSVENDAEVTLYWHSLGDTVSSTSSSDLNSTLTLHLGVKILSDSYSCVASNPVNLWIASADTEDLCLDKPDFLSPGEKAAIGIAVIIILMGIVIVILLYIRKKPMVLIKDVGESVTFKTPLKNGVLTCQGEEIAEVSNGVCTCTSKRFIGRVEWRDNNFHISDLTCADSGMYRVEAEDGPRRVTEFQLIMRVLFKNVGESVTFRAPIQNGLLTFQGESIAELSSGICTVKNERFTGRVQWSDSNVHISNLTLEDSGIFKVQDHDCKDKVMEFHLIIMHGK
ncbi:SLAM family member 8 [Amia ocellicauda]|uniref:SLAM family member 8 n=1 Tax=Amia ocellicauda TaxID=2972642 RepID=UPI0034645831